MTTPCLLKPLFVFQVALLSPVRSSAIVRPRVGFLGQLCSSPSETTDLELDPVEDLELDPVEDPVDALENSIGFTMQQRGGMEMNEIINIGFLALVSLATLAKLTMVDQDMMRGWTTAEMAYRLPIDNWTDYYQVLTDSPIQTKAVTSATVYTIGDIIAQRTEGSSMGELDRMRTLRSMLAGLIGHGPLSHYWYEFNEGIFNNVLHWTAWWSFFPKIIVDQTTWGPVWNNTYIILLGLMKQTSFGTIWEDIKRTTIPLVVSGLKLWPLAHCVTYGLIPVENRVLWVDLIEILWVTILATQAAGKGAAAETSNSSTEE